MSVSVFAELQRRLVQAWGDRRGNITATFAIALVPLIGFVGAAVDYSRASLARTQMQVALDSAVLMVSKDMNNGVISQSAISATAQTYFNSLYTNVSAPSVAVTTVYTVATSTTPATVKLSGAGAIDTVFMGLLGFPQMPLNATSVASWNANLLRIALVLDNTGSMANNGKLAALKSAATSFVG
jgi:Flp pilus assembly protein TadG